MTSKPSSLEWVFGLFSYDPAAQSPQAFERFYHGFLRELIRLGCPPNYIAADGPGYSGKLVPFSGKTQTKVIETNFSNLSGLSMVTTPPGGTKPGYERIASGCLTLCAGEAGLSIAINEAVIPFHSESGRLLALEALKWSHWSYGFGFRDNVSARPILHVISADTGSLSKGASEELTRWCNTDPSERQIKARGIYPMMVVNDRQMSQSTRTKIPIGELLTKHSNFTARVGDLTLIEIPEPVVHEFRQQVHGSSAVIASN